MTLPPAIAYSVATSVDVPAMVAAHGSEPTDSRMAAYFDRQHHPQQALKPRVGFKAVADGTTVGYIAGHLTTRNGCAGEVQYLYVQSSFRRQGIASALLRLLAEWFTAQGAARVCVPVANDSPPEAKPFFEKAGASPLHRFWYGWDDIADVALTSASPR